MEKRRRTESINGSDELLEEMIQHIQSFMNEKEAAKTSSLSKSWHKAWLTRPDLDLNSKHFNNIIPFQEFAFKTMKRYQDLKVRINSCKINTFEREFLFMNLVLKAIELGVTDLHLISPHNLPEEVLESKTLIRLSVKHCTLTSGNVNWGSLKSLTLCKVHADHVAIHTLLSRCSHSLEELKLYSFHTTSRGFFNVITWIGEPEPELEFFSSDDDNIRFEKLEFLSLEDVSVHKSFFDDKFSSRFPCLKDLSLYNCRTKSNSIRISSPSLQWINLCGTTNLSKVQLDCPRIRKFEYSLNYYRKLED